MNPEITVGLAYSSYEIFNSFYQGNMSTGEAIANGLMTWLSYGAPGLRLPGTGIPNAKLGNTGSSVGCQVGNALRRPLGARGPISGREFDPAAAGVPIRQLTTGRIKITYQGIDVVEQHVGRFGTDSANQLMIQRLRDIAAGKLQPTLSDLNFYSHELREFVRYRQLGWQAGQPPVADAAYELWNNAHTATLEDYGLREGPGVLYHPSAQP